MSMLGYEPMSALYTGLNLLLISCNSVNLLMSGTELALGVLPGGEGPLEFGLGETSRLLFGFLVDFLKDFIQF